jgi:hypothetical protein
LLSAVVPVNARAVWPQHVTSLVDTAPGDNDAVLDDVSAAIARTVLSGGQVYAFGAGVWASANSGPAAPARNPPRQLTSSQPASNSLPRRSSRWHRRSSGSEEDRRPFSPARWPPGWR